jgi:hypothetical protein
MDWNTLLWQIFYMEYMKTDWTEKRFDRLDIWEQRIARSGDSW